MPVNIKLSSSVFLVFLIFLFFILAEKSLAFSIKNVLKKSWLMVIFLLISFFIFSSKVYSSNIFINEIFPNPSGDENQEEWVEVYNNGGNQDLNGWRLYDEANHELIIESSKTQTGSTIVLQNSWLVIYHKGASFSLNNSGEETVKLYNGPIASSSSQLVDSVSYNGSTEEKSWGRIPDGSGSLVANLTKTPGSANQAPASPSPSPSPSPDTSVSPSSAPSPLPIVSLKPSPVVKLSPSPTPSSTENPQEENLTGEILGAEESPGASQKPKELSENQTSSGLLSKLPFFLIPLGAILVLLANFKGIKPKLQAFLELLKNKDKSTP